MAIRFMRHALRLTGTTLLATLALAGTALAATLAPAAASPAGHAGTGRNLDPATRFFVPPPDQGAVQQVLQLLKSGDLADAKLITRMEATPKAVWFDGGTPAQVQAQVRQTMTEAAFEHAVPVLVAYDTAGAPLWSTWSPTRSGTCRLAATCPPRCTRSPTPSASPN